MVEMLLELFLDLIKLVLGDLKILFKVDVWIVCFEVGFGGGEYLLYWV